MKLESIVGKVEQIINSAFVEMSRKDYISFILFIGRGDIVSGLNKVAFTDYVVDYQLDRYHDETRDNFYIRYLNRNYSSEGFNYKGESGIDDLSIEMMIYSHLWESTYFLKSLYRLAAILCGQGYQWDPNIPENGKYNFLIKEVITPLKKIHHPLGDLVEESYNSIIRNAFAHSLYSVDSSQRKIYTRTRHGAHTYTFDEFQELFLNSVIMMNRLQNILENNHDLACQKNTALTDSFLLPDGLKVQVYGRMIDRAESLYPEFRLVRILE